MSIVWAVRHGVPLMKENGGGAIVNMSSGSAVMTAPVKAAYASSKAAIETLTRYLAAQLGTDGIRCNAVRPGFVATEGIKELFTPDQLTAVAERSSLGRICAPTDIADVVVWLASRSAGYVNGAVVTVDGGGDKPAITW